MARHLPYPAEGLEVGASHRAVAVDAREDDARQRQVGPAPEERLQRDRVGVEPAGDRHLVIADVDRAHHHARVRERAPLEEVRVADRRGRHHDRLRAGVEKPVDRILRPDASGDLQLDARLLQHPRDHVAVARGTARGVEVDDVQALGAGGTEAARDVERVVAVDRRLLVAALRQPDRPAAEDVDRGDDDYR